MEARSGETERKILEAAKKVFILKGMAGARMQEIADEAGINKSLLHYYFRSKDQLFEAVFIQALKGFFPSVAQIVMQDISLAEKIKFFAAEYSKIIAQNPFIPGFILNELNRDPEKLIRFFREMVKPVRENVLPHFRDELKAMGSQADGIEIEDLIVDVIGMSIFPFIGRPMIQEILFGGDEERYQEFLSNRPDHIGLLIDRTLDNKKNPEP